VTGVLTTCGHEVVATVDGAEAWEAMRQPDAPALAILDWMLPGLAGVDVCRRIRGLGSNQPPDVIIFGVSRWTEDRTADTLLAAADAGLDRAKREGRNRVCLAGHQPPRPPG